MADAFVHVGCGVGVTVAVAGAGVGAAVVGARAVDGDGVVEGGGCSAESCC
jgi:F0F1-type ATP synthase membrane subunit c/vacuolar-type H+-ATPase subunit K